MRFFERVVIAIFFVFLATPAMAKDCRQLSSKTYYIVSDSGGDGSSRSRYRCYVLDVPNVLRGVVSLVHASGAGDWDILVGKKFDHDTLKMQSSITHKNSKGSANEFVILPSDASGRYEIVIWPTTTSKSAGCVLFHNFDESEIFAEALVATTLQHIIIGLLTGENASQKAQANAGRIAAIGMSVLKDRNPAQLGYDATMNEVSIGLSKTFGGGSFLFSLGTNYFGGFLEKAGWYSFEFGKLDCT